MVVEFLGTGTSHGIPVVGCSCPVCHSQDPKDQRYRASLLIRGNTGECCVIDTGPEFRLQAIRAGIQHLDAVFLTHAHADHLHGLDDVRPLSVHTPLNVFGNRPTIHELTERFSYIFRETQIGGGKPRIIPTILDPEWPEHKQQHTTEDPEASVSIGGLRFTPLPVYHGRLHILGWLVEEAGRRCAYLTDVSQIPKETLLLLAQLDILIIGALRKLPHPTHFSFDQALDIINLVRPRQAYLTHLCHDYFHTAIFEYLLEQGFSQNYVAPAYDGLRLMLEPLSERHGTTAGV
ncbi:MBL fold metallo-hydrolase [Gracilinema caldarium]|uniref:MBL fold metallo-hydrolase n=1 Tax=Gracilinema caldarium TaxID=215591 RepID=UPI0026EF60C7|nr:MBL fold metallo-hydrolase [Gracilinema caldarium]